MAGIPLLLAANSGPMGRAAAAQLPDAASVRPSFGPGGPAGPRRMLELSAFSPAAEPRVLFSASSPLSEAGSPPADAVAATADSLAKVSLSCDKENIAPNGLWPGARPNTLGPGRVSPNSWFSHFTGSTGDIFGGSAFGGGGGGGGMGGKGGKGSYSLVPSPLAEEKGTLSTPHSAGRTPLGDVTRYFAAPAPIQEQEQVRRASGGVVVGLPPSPLSISAKTAPELFVFLFLFFPSRVVRPNSARRGEWSPPARCAQPQLRRWCQRSSQQPGTCPGGENRLPCGTRSWKGASCSCLKSPRGICSWGEGGIIQRSS